jgi:hypothetical protein
MYISTNKSDNMLTYVFPRGINMEFFIQKHSESLGRLYVESCTKHCRVSLIEATLFDTWLHSLYFDLQFYSFKGTVACEIYVLCAKKIIGWNVVHSKERHTNIA